MRGKPRLDTVVMCMCPRFVVAPSGDSDPCGRTRRHAPSSKARPPRASHGRQVDGDRSPAEAGLRARGRRTVRVLPTVRRFPGGGPVLHGEGRFHIPLRGSAGFDPWVLPASLKHIALSRYSDMYLGGVDLTPARGAGQAAAKPAEESRDVVLRD